MPSRYDKCACGRQKRRQGVAVSKVQRRSVSGSSDMHGMSRPEGRQRVPYQNSRDASASFGVHGLCVTDGTI